MAKQVAGLAEGRSGWQNRNGAARQIEIAQPRSSSRGPAEVQIADVGFLCYIVHKQAHDSASGWRVDELLVLGLC